MAQFIKNLFGSKKDIPKNGLSTYNEFLFNKVIELLRREPESFSINWFGETISNSERARKNDLKVVIHAETGEVIHPVIEGIASSERNTVKTLIKPILAKLDKDQFNNRLDSEKLIIDKAIELLKREPENFSSRWAGESVGHSVRSNDGKILIMIHSGEIIFPIDANMTRAEMKIVRDLVKPIVSRNIED